MNALSKFVCTALILLALPISTTGKAVAATPDTWVAVGTLNQPITLPNPQKCNLRLTIRYAPNGTPLTIHFYPNQDFVSGGNPGYGTSVYQLNYMGMTTLNEAGILPPDFFAQYVARTADPQERPLESLITVGLSAGAPAPASLQIWYRYIDSESHFHGPTVMQPDRSRFTLEKQCL